MMKRLLRILAKWPTRKALNVAWAESARRIVEIVAQEDWLIRLD